MSQRRSDGANILPAPNPFVHARALKPEEAIARDADVEHLTALAAGGHNAVLHAPRRFGKTTVLNQVLERSREHAMPGVLVDLSDVLSAADVAARLSQAYRALPQPLRDAVRHELASVTIPTPFGSFGVARRATAPAPVESLHTLLEIPAQIAARSGQRVVVVLDEFQALVDLKGFDGLFRSHLQHHDAVSYIFCGSEPSLLRSLFEDRARPLYGQAELVRLGRLDPGTAATYVEQEFDRTGRDARDVAAHLAGPVAQGHPQRLMLVAHRLWERVHTGGHAGIADLRAAHDAALRSVAPELSYLWAALTPNERRVLGALASGFSPYQREGELFFGLASRSSAQRSVDALTGRGIVERDEPALRIVDPLLERWVARRGSARVNIYVLPHGGRFVVCDGPSLAFQRSAHESLDAAQAAADALAARATGADIMVFDSDDPNDLPGWALEPA